MQFLLAYHEAAYRSIRCCWVSKGLLEGNDFLAKALKQLLHVFWFCML